MCHVPHPKRKAVVASPAPTAVLAVVASLAPAKPATKCRPTHPSGLVLDILGIAMSNRGHPCKEHMVCCGDVVEEDIVVRLHKERILVPNFLTGNGKMREETAITVNWVTDGIDRCPVGFLPRAFTLDDVIYNGILFQATEVFGKNDPSCAIRDKWNTNKGFARVISLLSDGVLSKGGEMVAHKGIKGD